VQSYEGGVFYDCWKLQSVTIPSAMTNLSFGPPALNLSLINDGPVFGNCRSITTVTIPGTVVDIYGFQGCTALNNVVIPASVLRVDDNAFRDCDNLTRVTFMGTGTNISNGTNVFPGALYDRYPAQGSGTYVRTKGQSSWRKEY
jgi:hypothetical protein